MQGTNTVKLIEKIEVSKEIVKASERRSYNPSIWEKNIDRYASYPECKFYYEEKAKEYFAIYVADGIRFMQTIEYGSMLSGSGLQVGYIKNDAIDFRLFENNHSIEKTESNRKILRLETKFSQDIFFWG